MFCKIDSSEFGKAEGCGIGGKGRSGKASTLVLLKGFLKWNLNLQHRLWIRLQKQNIIKITIKIRIIKLRV